jgi:hypothetical protein
MNIIKRKLLLSTFYKLISIILGCFIFLTIIMLDINSYEVDTYANAYIDFLYVGMAFGLFFGIPASYFIEFILYFFKIKHKVTYNIIHLALHTLAGSLIPILGNMIAFITTSLYLLLTNGKFKLFLSLIFIYIIILISIFTVIATN